MANFWTTLPKPFLVLAPMEDVTDFVFREIICQVAKPDVLVTEFTSVDGLFSKGHDKVIRSLLYSEHQRPIVAQVWGTNPENFYKAAQLVNQLKFDGIDLNMGCPAESVTSKQAGAALIKDQSLAKEIIAATKKGAGDMAVSVKTRVGYNTIVTKDWISFLLGQKLDALIVHGRTAKDMSKVPAKWEEIAKAVELKNAIAPDTILIGNGDVKNYEDALRKHQDYKVDGVMIGRGIFANPWVFEKTQPAQPHTTKERIELLLKHSKLYSDKWGSDKNFEALKKFFKMYVINFRGADDLRQQLMQCKNYLEVEAVIKNSNIL